MSTVQKEAAHHSGDEDRAGKIKRAALTNLGLFGLTVVSGVVTGNTALLADSGHEASDSVIHGSRYLAEEKGVDQSSRRFTKFRKAAFYMSGLFASLMTGKMIYDATTDGLDEPPAATWQSAMELSTATAIAAGNIYAHRQTSKIKEHSHASQDSHNHNTVDRNASVGLAATVAASTAGVPLVGPIGGMAFGVYTAGHLIRHGRQVGDASEAHSLNESE